MRVTSAPLLAPSLELKTYMGLTRACVATVLVFQVRTFTACTHALLSMQANLLQLKIMAKHLNVVFVGIPCVESLNLERRYEWNDELTGH